MTSFKLRVMAQVLPFLLIAPGLTVAQAQTPPSRGEAMAAMKATPQKASAQYTRQQIDQLIAPIALYPDQLLAQVLMAATYPQQLLDASRIGCRTRSTPGLQGDELAQALEPLPWDPSVKALVAFPPIIAMMTEHLEWTEAIGLAFATQQAQVMQRVQGLRQLAVKSGRIRNVKHVTVRQDANVITIVSAEPDRVFVPVYNPTARLRAVAGPRLSADLCHAAAAFRDGPPRNRCRNNRAWLRGLQLSGRGASLGLDTAGLAQQPDHDPDRRVHAHHPRRAAAAQRPVAARGPDRDRHPIGGTRAQTGLRVRSRPGPSRRPKPPRSPHCRSERRGSRIRSGSRGEPRPRVRVPRARTPPETARRANRKGGQAGRRLRRKRRRRTRPRPTRRRREGAGRQGPGAERAQAQAIRRRRTRLRRTRLRRTRRRRDKAQADKAQADKAQADKAQAEKAQADKAQAAKAQAEKAQADKAQADKDQAAKAQADKAQADKDQAAGTSPRKHRPTGPRPRKLRRESSGREGTGREGAGRESAGRESSGRKSTGR